MLSYDAPVPVNSKNPISPADIPAGLQQPCLPGGSGGPSQQSTIIRAGAGSSDGLMQASTAAAAAAAAAERQQQHHHIWLVTGPAGCGKSTVAKHMANVLHLPYLEGDEYHPPANIEKMSNGIPLTDADRWDWLTALREESVRQLASPSTGPGPGAGAAGVVLTCSALKRKYRDVIRVAPYFSPWVHLHFIYLHAPEEVLLQRVLARQGHYMGANMVRSQFEILEPPTADEVDVVSVDVSKSPDEVNAEVLDRVLRIMKEVEEGRGGSSRDRCSAR